MPFRLSIVRRLQFRLSTLLILIAAIAVPLAIRSASERRYRAQLAALAVLENHNDRVGVGVDNSVTSDFAYEREVVVDSLKRDDEVTYVKARPAISGEEISAVLCFPTVQCLDLVDYVGGAPLGSIDAALGRLSTLPSVEWLYLEGSGVTDDGASHLGGLRSLRVLDLEGAQISGATFGKLSPLRKLERLVLRDTSFTDDGARHLAALTSLRVLDLHGTKVSDAALAPIGTLRQLKILNLAGTEVGDDGMRRLASLKSLEWLDLGGTRISGAALAHLSDATGLQNLCLQGNEIEDASLHWLLRLPRLTDLDLSGTHVTDEGLEILGRLNGLEMLHLRRCSISDSGLARLARMRSLRTLNIEQTLVSADGVAELKRRKPKPPPLTGQKLASARSYGIGPQQFNVFWSEPTANQGAKTSAE